MSASPRATRGVVVLSILVALIVGATVGVGAFTFGYAEGGSYFSGDAASCANCHVMQGHFDAWAKSSHSAFASCNDCHAPASGIPKLYSKARNGFFHSLAFTTGDFQDNLRITEYNRGVTEAACRGCHTNTIEQIDAHQGFGGSPEPIDCIRCHATVGHDR